MYNQKIKDLRAFLTGTLHKYEYEKINLSDNEFAERLKMTCYFIDEKITSTIEYYQYNKASITEIEKAKDKCKDLSILLNKYKTELTKLGINTNKQLSFKKEVNDAFDFELTENTKELLPNYLEIEKEFSDCIHIETSTETIKQKSNKDKTKENWFIIGVKFATGEMQLMLKENNPPEVAEILGNKKGFRPYITSTLGTKKESLKYKDKNIYTRKKADIELILDYCKKNNLIVCQEFKDEIKHIITD